MQRLHTATPTILLPWVTLALGTVLGNPASAAAEEAIETVAGKTLTIVRDRQSVRVSQAGRVLLRYRYAGVPKKPYVCELTAPGGENVLRDAPADHLHHHGLMFAWSVDGVDFWSENASCGAQAHQQWKLRIEGSGGSEKAILRQQLVWQSPQGNRLLRERRTLTVPAAVDTQPRILTWQADFTGGPDAANTLTFYGAKYNGLGMRFVQSMDADGLHFNAAGGVKVAGTNGKRAPWSAYTARVAAGRKVTVAMFDAPANPRHPTEWFTMGETPPFAYLAGTLGVGSEPLKLELGKTISVRFGVAVFDGAVDADLVRAAYLRWLRL